MKKLILLPLLFLSFAQAETTEEKIFIYHVHVGVGPYSSANHYIYEKNNEVICTKITVCNKYDNCGTSYTKGLDNGYLPDDWKETGIPILIKPSSQKKHICLTRKDLL